MLLPLLLLGLLLPQSCNGLVGSEREDAGDANPTPPSNLRAANSVKTDQATDDNKDDALQHYNRLRSGGGLYHRALSKQCPRDPDLKEEHIWYTIEVNVLTRQEAIVADDTDWSDVRTFIQEELANMDLFTDYGVEDLNLTLCDDRVAEKGIRRKLVIQDSMDPSATQTVIEEDDERFHRYLTSDRFLKDWLDKLVFIWYELFFRGGDRCAFCFKDDKDLNSRRGLLEMTSVRHPTHNEGVYDTVRTTTNTKNSFDADNVANPHNDKVRVFLDTRQEKDGVEKVDDSVLYPSIHTHRSLACDGGCYRLDGHVDGSGNPFSGTKYLDPLEYWETLFGVKIYVSEKDESCVAGGNKVRLYDMSDPGPDSLSLGSPNKDCDSNPGPGVGWGGKMKCPHHMDNVFKNCPSKQASNAAFTVQGDGIDFVGCDSGFSITFQFKYPVSMRRVALLNVVEDDSATVYLHFQDGAMIEVNAVGAGPNSAQRINLDNAHLVVKLVVQFQSSGGTSFFFYSVLFCCVLCGDCLSGILGWRTLCNTPKQHQQSLGCLVCLEMSCIVGAEENPNVVGLFDDAFSFHDQHHSKH